MGIILDFAILLSILTQAFNQKIKNHFLYFIRKSILWLELKSKLLPLGKFLEKTLDVNFFILFDFLSHKLFSVASKMDVIYKQRTTFPKKSDLMNRWVVVDASNQIAGRLASKVVSRLLGKHRPNYTPGALLGDSVIIINAGKIKFTGSKMTQKQYITHTGFIGGLKRKKLKDIPKNKALLYAIKGMLPKTKYGHRLLKRLRIVPGEEYSLKAQKPEVITL